MSNSKCSKCGLVNPIGITECKRCGFTLILSEIPVVANAQRGLREFVVTSREPEVGSFGSGNPVQGVCSICGACVDVEMVKFVLRYNPAWHWIFIFFGVLIGLLIRLALSVKHSFVLPLCSPCARRHELSTMVEIAAVVSCIVLVITAIIVGVSNESWLAFFAVAAIAVAVGIFAGKFDRSANPRYAKISSDDVEVEVPGRGRVLVSDTVGV